MHLVTMTSMLDEARAALQEPRWDVVCDRVHHLCVLYDAATSTMQYASDFGQDMYEQLIRPSMAPPFVSPGFSGVFNLEHEQMASSLRDFRHRFKQLQRSAQVPAEARDAAKQLWRAESRNRRSHVLICERFVPEGKSLLSAYFAEQDENELTTPDSQQQQPHR
ncbi:hypothetical protein [Aeromicrobium sp. CF3.5]|uniref:hypothetical protein n=1 Tax=Aeromicrobium sp. CF3.5 TaxID=3373078 RepID=UPI003EE6DC3D